MTLVEAGKALHAGCPNDLGQEGSDVEWDDLTGGHQDADMARAEALLGIRLGGLWAKDDLRRAFVAGAKWWEFKKTGGTMWPSDTDKVEAAAAQRYPKGEPK